MWAVGSAAHPRGHGSTAQPLPAPVPGRSPGDHDDRPVEDTTAVATEDARTAVAAGDVHAAVATGDARTAAGGGEAPGAADAGDALSTPREPPPIETPGPADGGARADGGPSADGKADAWRRFAFVPVTFPLTVGGTTFAFFVAFRAQAQGTVQVVLLSAAGLAYAAVTGITLYLSGHVQRRAKPSTAELLDRLAGILLTAIAVTILISGVTRLVLEFLPQ